MGRVPDGIQAKGFEKSDQGQHHAGRSQGHSIKGWQARNQAVVGVVEEGRQTRPSPLQM